MSTIESRSPHDPEDLVASTATASPDSVAEAARAARTAQRAWAANATARATALGQAAELVAGAAAELTSLIVREVGKPAGEAGGEVARAVAILRYYSQQVFDPVGELHEPSASGLLFTKRRPHGVVGLITPWNFPIAIPLWKAAPALAFGNAVLLKPAPEATGTAVRLGELMAEALGSADLFAVLPGDVETGEAVIARADAVSFTGSVAAGRSVARAATERGIPVQAEMGGQNPAIVLPDADLDAAAGHVATAAMGYAGQKCTATKRVIVVGDPEPFRSALVTAIEKLGAGDPGDDGVAVGPVIDSAARDAVVEAARSAEAAGGTVLTGGTAVEGASGWHVGATLVEGVPADHVLAVDEVFGPICLLQTAPDVDAAIELANGVEYGLAAAIYTRDLNAALAAADRLEAGLVKINAPTSGVDFYLPFGGEKSSSIGGREQGKAARDFYTTVHTVTLAPN